VIIKDRFKVIKYHGRYGTTIKCPSCGVYTYFITPEQKRRMDKGEFMNCECDGCAAYREHISPY